MFNDAGYPLTPDGKLTDELINEIFVYGDEDTIRQRLYAMHEAGVDEIVAIIHPIKDLVHKESRVQMPRHTRPTFSTTVCEGALFPPDFLRKIVDRDPSLEGVSEGTYHIIGEKLNEVINASWMHLLQRWRTVGRTDANCIKEQWFYPLFAELGYGRLPTTKPVEVDGKRYSISHNWGCVPIHYFITGLREFMRKDTHESFLWLPTGDIDEIRYRPA